MDDFIQAVTIGGEVGLRQECILEQSHDPTSQVQIVNKGSTACIPHEPKILMQVLMLCRQTGHFGETSLSIAKAQRGQHTRCPQGTNADLLRLIKQTTQSSPSATSPVSSSTLISGVASLCNSWAWRLLSLHSFHFNQFLH